MANHSASLPLLAACACAVGHLAQQVRVRTTIHQGVWPDLPTAAEDHGLTPLVFTHLQASDGPIPIAIQTLLRTRYLQHAHAAQVRTQILAEVLDCYQAEGIAVLLLKGAALAHLIYPMPALRPMRDIDLLVHPADAHRAQALLGTAGFDLPPTPTHQMPADHHHLASVSRTLHGVPVSLEVHQALDLHAGGRNPWTFADLAPAAQAVVVAGRTAQTLGREAMLWHVYRHAFGESLTGQALRLIWVADLVTMVEAWVDTLDWARLRRAYPALYRMLPLLHALTPWSPRVQARLAGPFPDQPPPRLHFVGWPRVTIAAQRPKGVRGILRDTVFPAGWWLRTTYGEDASRRGYLRAWRAHQRRLWAELRRAGRIHGAHRLRHLRRRFRPALATSVTSAPPLHWTVPPGTATEGTPAYADAVLALINTAQRELVLVSPWIAPLLTDAGRNTVTNAVLGALYRGVQVTLVSADTATLGAAQRQILDGLRAGAARHGACLVWHVVQPEDASLVQATIIIRDREAGLLGTAAASADSAVGLALPLDVTQLFALQRQLMALLPLLTQPFVVPGTEGAGRMAR